MSRCAAGLGRTQTDSLRTPLPRPAARCRLPNPHPSRYTTEPTPGVSAGRTVRMQSTVVAPLLALLLGNHETLVMQVVPAALLQFSRSVMRQRFSSLLQKPVYTFHFDRFTAASPELLSKLLRPKPAPRPPRPK